MVLNKRSFMKKNRQVNLEILRILCMLMIITIHVANHGMLITFAQKGTLSYYIVWTLFGFGFSCINLYILISGYFLVDSHFSSWRVIKLELQVLFYALGITLLFWITGWAREREMKYMIYSVTPIISDFYWFPTMYVGMVLLAPLLNRLARSLTKRQFQCTLVLLFVLFSVWSTVFFYSSGMNIAGGAAEMWFLVVYMFGAYLKLHYVPENKPGKWVLLGIIFSLSVPISRFVIEALLDTPLGKISFLDDLMWGYSVFFQYNSILVCLAAGCIFIAFLNMPHLGEGIMAPLIRWLGACAFGAYLIHDHYYIREWFWEKLAAYNWLNQWYLPLAIIGTVFAIFLVCALLDSIRMLIFSIIEKKLKLSEKCLKLDTWLKKKWNA